MNRHQEVEAREDRRKPEDEQPGRREHDIGVEVGRAQGGVEGPAGIDSSGNQGEQGESGPDHVDIPTDEVEARERHILGPDHQGQHEVAQRRRHERNEHEEHHDHAMRGERLVVEVARQQVALGGDQLRPEQPGVESAQDDQRLAGDHQPRADRVLEEHREADDECREYAGPS